MMEPAELPPMRPLPEKRPPWSLTGAKGRDKNIVTSLYLGAASLEQLNLKLQAKLSLIERNNEVRYEELYVEDADIVLVAFGTAARVAQTAVQRLRRNGIRAGLFRPITLWPFPSERLLQLTYIINSMLVVEMNAGQMVHDVREATGHRVPVQFLGRMGGIIPMPEEVEAAVYSWLAEKQ
jgi:2-oxoglutarate ferredoxin oxidoreductase subunit alpha